MTPNQEIKNTYTGIQALRFVAAMLVVLAHSTAMVNERMHLDMFKWRAGWSGVDIGINTGLNTGAKNFIDKLLQYISTTKAGAIIGAVAVVISFAIMFNCAEQPMWWRWAYWGIPSMVIVLVVALGEPALRKVMPKILATLGDSSYSLYLFHTFTVPLLGTLMLKLKLAQPTLALAACIVISPLVCLAIYAWFELPMTTRLKRFARF